MREIIVGYSGTLDDAENGVPLMTEGGGLRLFKPEDFDRSKERHRFPEGVGQFKRFNLVEVDNSVFIGTNIGDMLEKTEKERADAADKEKEKAKVQSMAEKTVNDAKAKVQSTARARNDLMGKLHQAEAKLNAHEATPETLRGKIHDRTVGELQRLILGDPEKKIAGLKDQVEDAKAEYEKAAAELAELTKPLNAPAAPQSQFVH